MAEERDVGLARAPETDNPTDAAKEDLQRRMEEARESITQTVTEIKETVVNQYQQVRESINDTLDWREQYRRHTVPFTVGAVGVGFVLGYSVGGAIFGRGDGEYYDEEDYDSEAEESGRLLPAPRSYAAQPILGTAAAAGGAASARPSTDTERSAYAEGTSSSAGAPSSFAGAARAADVGPDTRPSYGAADESSGAAEGEPQKPGLLDRFKETKAYDRLQQELYTLGDRAVEELSKTAQTVVLPAILGKLKDLVGIDLSTQREVAQRSRLEQQAAKASAASASPAGGAGGSSTGEPRM